jgi:hypothetical protein
MTFCTTIIRGEIFWCELQVRPTVPLTVPYFSSRPEGTVPQGKNQQEDKEVISEQSLGILCLGWLCHFPVDIITSWPPTSSSTRPHKVAQKTSFSCLLRCFVSLYKDLVSPSLFASAILTVDIIMETRRKIAIEYRVAGVSNKASDTSVASIRQINLRAVGYKARGTTQSHLATVIMKHPHQIIFSLND